MSGQFLTSAPSAPAAPASAIGIRWSPPAGRPHPAVATVRRLLHEPVHHAPAVSAGCWRRSARRHPRPNVPASSPPPPRAAQSLRAPQSGHAPQSPTGASPMRILLRAPATAASSSLPSRWPHRQTHPPRPRTEQPSQSPRCRRCPRPPSPRHHSAPASLVNLLATRPQASPTPPPLETPRRLQAPIRVATASATSNTPPLTAPSAALTTASHRPSGRFSDTYVSQNDRSEVGWRSLDDDRDTRRGGGQARATVEVPSGSSSALTQLLARYVDGSAMTATISTANERERLRRDASIRVDSRETPALPLTLWSRRCFVGLGFEIGGIAVGGLPQPS